METQEEYERQAFIILMRIDKFIKINPGSENEYLKGIIQGLKAIDKQKGE